MRDEPPQTTRLNADSELSKSSVSAEERESAGRLTRDSGDEPTIDLDKPTVSKQQPAPNTQSVPLESIGQYRLIRKLGEGGMGAVYEAVHERLEKRVALKVLSPKAVGDRQATDRFNREMKAIGRVQHANVVVAHDGGQIGPQSFLVMEYVDGVNIHQLDDQLDGLEVADACEIIRQAALGLHHAHEMGLIHRDIKPSNLMLDRSGVVKVLDLGLARMYGGESDPSDELTQTGTTMGSLGYMAPEQALDSRTADVRSDIYSLGSTLFRLLTRQLPFDPRQYNTTAKMLVAITTGEVPSIQTLRADLPSDLVGLVDKMMAKDPSVRTGSAKEIANALSPYARSNLVGLIDGTRSEKLKTLASPIQNARAGSSGDPLQIRPRSAKRPTSTKPKKWVFAVAGCLIVLAVIGLTRLFSVETPDEEAVVANRYPQTRLSMEPTNEVSDLGAMRSEDELAVGSPSAVDAIVQPSDDVYAVDRNVIQLVHSLDGQCRNEKNQVISPEPAVQQDPRVFGVSLEGNQKDAPELYRSLRLLPKLRSLNVAGCRLNAKDVAAIAKIRTLESLNLSRNDLSSLDLFPLGGHYWINHLTIDGEQLSGDLSWLVEIHPLRMLTINQPEWSRLSVLEEIPQLRCVELCCDTKIPDATLRQIQTANPYLQVQVRSTISPMDSDSQAYATTQGIDRVTPAARELLDSGWKIFVDSGQAFGADEVLRWNQALRVQSPVGADVTAALTSLEMLGLGPHELDLSHSTNLDGLSWFLSGRPIRVLRVNGSADPPDMLPTLAFKTMLDQLFVSDFAIASPEIEAFRTLQPGCEVHLADEVLPAQHRLPESLSKAAPEIPSDLSPQKVIFRVVKAHDGSIRYRSVPGSAEQTMRYVTSPSDLDQPIKILSIRMAGADGLAGPDFELLSSALRKWWPEDCRLNLAVNRSDVVMNDLVGLRGIPIDNLATWGSAVNPGWRPSVCRDLDLHAWDIGGGCGFDDMQAALGVPGLEELRISPNGIQSPESLNERLNLIAESDLQSFHLTSWGPFPTLSQACQQTLQRCDHLTMLMLGRFSNVNEFWVDDLAAQFPMTSIFRGKNRVSNASINQRRIEAIASDGLAIVDTEIIPDPPSGRYTLRFNARRLTGRRESLEVALPVGEQHIYLILSGIDGLDSAFAPSDGKSEVLAQGNTTCFEEGKPHQFSISVTPSRIDVQMDDERFLQWRGSISDASDNAERWEAKPGHIAFRPTSWTPFMISNLSVQPLEQ